MARESIIAFTVLLCSFSEISANEALRTYYDDDRIRQIVRGDQYTSFSLHEMSIIDENMWDYMNNNHRSWVGDQNCIVVHATRYTMHQGNAEFRSYIGISSENANLAALYATLKCENDGRTSGVKLAKWDCLVSPEDFRVIPYCQGTGVILDHGDTYTYWTPIRNGKKRGFIDANVIDFYRAHRVPQYAH